MGRFSLQSWWRDLYRPVRPGLIKIDHHDQLMGGEKAAALAVKETAAAFSDE